MSLETFSLPKSDTRLITLNDTIHKIKLHLVKPPRHSHSNHGQTTLNTINQEEIEQIIIALLTSSERLQPIRTNNFTVYPYRKTWKTADKVGFYRHKKLLKCCPYVHSFYIEDKSSTVTNEEASKNDKECVLESELSDDEDTQSVSILDGLHDQNKFSSTEEIHETLEGSHDEKEDREITYEKATSSMSVNPQKRKTQDRIPSEEESLKKKYSVSEYLDKNRHEVQEQDLQEQLRFQALASPGDEKEAASGTEKTNFQRVMSSIAAVKRLMFGQT